MPEFKINPETQKYIDNTERVRNGLKNQFVGLLTNGGRITPDGRILNETDETQEEFKTVKPESIINLSYWFDQGEILFASGESLDFIGELTQHARSVLETEGFLETQEGLPNPRFKVNKYTQNILKEIADEAGQGKIQKPQQAA